MEAADAHLCVDSLAAADHRHPAQDCLHESIAAPTAAAHQSQDFPAHHSLHQLLQLLMMTLMDLQHHLDYSAHVPKCVLLPRPVQLKAAVVAKRQVAAQGDPLVVTRTLVTRRRAAAWRKDSRGQASLT